MTFVSDSNNSLVWINRHFYYKQHSLVPWIKHFTQFLGIIMFLTVRIEWPGRFGEHGKRVASHSGICLKPFRKSAARTTAPLTASSLFLPRHNLVIFQESQYHPSPPPPRNPIQGITLPGKLESLVLLTKFKNKFRRRITKRKRRRKQKKQKKK